MIALLPNGQTASPDAAANFEDLPARYGWQTQNERGYKIKEKLFGSERPLRVVALGAGAAGICLAKFLPELLHNVSLAIYDKNPEFGGTWYENRYVTISIVRWNPVSQTLGNEDLVPKTWNEPSLILNPFGRYPGCACDIPSHIYQVCQ